MLRFIPNKSALLFDFQSLPKGSRSETPFANAIFAPKYKPLCETMDSCGFVFPAPKPFTQTTKPQVLPRIAYYSQIRSTSISRTSRCNLRMTQDPPAREPVEEGVTLPKLSDHDELMKQSAWLQNELILWLDSEWKQAEHQPVHEEIGQRAGMIYTRQRMEGEDDLSSVMLAIGSGLEGMDFSQAFVGPWNVANQAAELLLEHCAGERIKWRPSFPRESDSNASTPENTATEGSKKRRRAVPPSLANSFERMKFLQDVLDGSASKEVIDGAVAVAVGYRYDASTGLWDGSDVEDEHFRLFKNNLPDILGDEEKADMTSSLLYLENALQQDDEGSNEVADGLQVVVETLHGADLAKVQMEDPKDHSFRKRVIVAKWLHLFGGF